MPRADKAAFIQGMLSEHQLRQEREALKPEPDSKEWWREVAQGLGVKCQAAEALATQAEAEREAFKRIACEFYDGLVGAGMAGGYDHERIQRAASELDALLTPTPKDGAR